MTTRDTVLRRKGRVVRFESFYFSLGVYLEGTVERVHKKTEKKDNHVIITSYKGTGEVS